MEQMKRKPKAQHFLVDSSTPLAWQPPNPQPPGCSRTLLLCKMSGTLEGAPIMKLKGDIRRLLEARQRNCTTTPRGYHSAPSRGVRPSITNHIGQHALCQPCQPEADEA